MTEQGSTFQNVIGTLLMLPGVFLLVIFGGCALHVAKNGPGDGSFPALGISLPVAALGGIMAGAGFALCRRWLVNRDDPVQGLELASVLLCELVAIVIGIVYLAQGRSRGARLILTVALILAIKLFVASLVWNPNL